MAELELSALQRQCLDRRLPDRPTVERETIDWRFTTADARIKVKRLYPAVHA
jgi:hypothetical protein